MASIKLSGNTSGEITISSPDVAGTHTLTLPSATETLATQNSLGVRNLIINGDMRIAQRGNSATSISSSSVCQTVDRFALDLSGAGTWTQTQDTDVPTGQGFSSSLKMDCTTANGSLGASAYNIFHQRVESQLLQHLKYGTANAESVTLSFWVKSNKTGTYIAELYSYGNYQISQSYTIDSANTWEKKTITYAGNTISSIPNDNTLGLYVNLFLAAGSDRSSGTLNTSWASSTNANRAVGQVNLADSTDNYINITAVQLEVGTEATPFEHRPYDMELARCQRYYQQITGMIGYTGSVGTNGPQCSINYPVAMRATPDTSQSGVFRFDNAAAGFTQSSTGFGQGFNNNRGQIIQFGNMSMSQAYNPFGKANTATLNLDAEL